MVHGSNYCGSREWCFCKLLVLLANKERFYTYILYILTVCTEYKPAALRLRRFISFPPDLAPARTSDKSGT